MCLQLRRICQCGRQAAFLSFRDNILFPEILVQLYCPACGPPAQWDGDTMIEDCGWVLQYDLDRARVRLVQRGVKGTVTPEFLLIEGYLSWLGFSPGDHEVSAELHHRLAPLIERDLPLYLKTLKTEWLAHVAALKAAGWRKAQRA
jgi:hypothetical protein